MHACRQDTERVQVLLMSSGGLSENAQQAALNVSTCSFENLASAMFHLLPKASLHKKEWLDLHLWQHHGDTEKMMIPEQLASAVTCSRKHQHD